MKMIKKKAHEKLSDDNIQKVIGLLRQESPITKKEACEILNIRYNTTRLQNIIDDYEDTLAFKTKRKDQLRGKPASEDEIKSVVQSYIEGENILTDRMGYPQFFTQLLFKKDSKDIFIKTVINNEEGITKISSCKNLERYKKES